LRMKVDFTILCKSTKKWFKISFSSKKLLLKKRPRKCAFLDNYKRRRTRKYFLRRSLRSKRSKIHVKRKKLLEFHGEPSKCKENF